MEEVAAKSVGRADILHNSNYNDDFLSSKITTLKIVRSELITSIMYTLLGVVFYVLDFCWRSSFAIAILWATCNVLH